MPLLTKEMTIHYGTISIDNSSDANHPEMRMIVNISGDNLNQDIEDYMGRMHNIHIDRLTAACIRKAVGSALPELNNAPDDYTIEGLNRVTNKPMKVTVSYQETAHALARSISRIEQEITQTLEIIHPKFYADIVKQGITLTGSGATLRGLAERIEANTHIPCHVDPEEPMIEELLGVEKDSETSWMRNRRK